MDPAKLKRSSMDTSSTTYTHSNHLVSSISNQERSNDRLNVDTIDINNNAMSINNTANTANTANLDPDLAEKQKILDKKPSLGDAILVSVMRLNLDESQSVWKLVARDFVFIWLVLGIIIFGVFSIYWGSLYNRHKYMKHLPYLFVNNDEQVSLSDNSILPAYLGNVTQSFTQSEAFHAIGSWHIYNKTAFVDKYDLESSDEETIQTKIQTLVHHREFWAAVYIPTNTTFSIYEAFKTADSSFNPNAAASSSSTSSFGPAFQIIYESGTDPNVMGSTIVPALKVFAQTVSSLFYSSVYTPILSNFLNSTEKSNLINTAPQILSNIPLPYFIDNIPFTNTVMVAPLQVGLIYVIILTFFQFLFFLRTHLFVMRRLRGHLMPTFLIYRMISSQITYLFLSLAYCALSAAFQVPMNNTFGKSGFLVYWMITFLTMSAVGGANENAASFIMPVFPPLIGFWVLLWVIINVAPSISPIILLPGIFKYGYAFPMYNSSELTKVVFLNTWKGEMGKNIGILVAWIVVNNLLFPFALKWFNYRISQIGVSVKTALGE